ncbi:MAG: acetyl-CoA carboxylase biotin carboxylase subunit [Bacteroidetes bacterium]|nr:acetyl-CoA carboxylase biotin carboxylase subunit [Bacteroidota bacterium]
MGAFKKVLIANRGEIAIRVMRTCREMGIQTVAVFSEADQKAMHIRFADEAYCIGAPSSSDSYLRMDRILEVCKKTGADAVHPGYGFLSENAAFAKLLAANNIELIGPSAASMEMMGDKIASKQAVEKFGVPLVPGINEAIRDENEALQIAKDIGFPVLVKASAGGGGKGMRIVNEASEFLSALKTAKSEAKSAFGDDSVFIEKYVDGPRHIEFQILADKHGNIFHLFERECSIQRRHQKLVEEAPSSILTPELREKMGTAAVNVARACNYHGAGTVEFLVSSSGEFYFLEMNTRLQVEHPVTECITGLDLVKEQILVAQGGKLEWKQEEIKMHGHSVELRICAEDPWNNFLPSTGILTHYERPQGPGIRVDDCMEPGAEIPIYYDNMLAKLIAWGENRELAIQRLRRAIAEFKITGIETTLAFGEFVLSHSDFIQGNFDTHFIAKNFKPDTMQPAELDDTELEAIASSAVYFFKNNQAKTPSKPVSESENSWIKNRKKYFN